MGIRKCSFCNKQQNKSLTKTYCTSCYQYFCVSGYILFTPSKYGQLNRVTDKKSKQYDMCICHECGKAYVKLQQHIYYQHGMKKNEYCDKWGLDHSINMTTKAYRQKMSDYAYKNEMDKQLISVGVNTRFTKGNPKSYTRSFQTVQRLKNNFKDRRKNSE